MFKRTWSLQFLFRVQLTLNDVFEIQVPGTRLDKLSNDLAPDAEAKVEDARDPDTYNVGPD